MLIEETENDKKSDIIPVDSSRPEPEILPQPLNAILKEPEESQVRYNMEPDDNDKITYAYHFDK